MSVVGLTCEGGVVAGVCADRGDLGGAMVVVPVVGGDRGAWG